MVRGLAFSFSKGLFSVTPPLWLFGLMLPFDPFFDNDIGSPVGFSIIGIVPSVCVFAVEDDRMGTLGTGPPSTSLSCVPGIAADDEAISSSPPAVLSTGSGAGGSDVVDGIGDLYVELSAGFTVEDAVSATNISMFRCVNIPVAADSN